MARNPGELANELRKCKERYADSSLFGKSAEATLDAYKLERNIELLRNSVEGLSAEVLDTSEVTKGYDSFLRSIYADFHAWRLTGKVSKDEHPMPENLAYQLGHTYSLSFCIKEMPILQSDILMAAINKYFVNKGERVDQPPNSGGHS